MRTIHNYFLKYLALFFLCINTLQADNERWYEVELVIFKHSRAESFATEQWPDSWPIPNTDNSVNLKRPNKKHAKNFRLSQTSETSFDEVLASLDASSRYEVLSYESWQQRGLNKNNAVGVQIQAGQQYSPVNTEIQTDIGDQETQTGSLFVTHTDEYGIISTRKIQEYQIADPNSSSQKTYELEGTIKIVLSRFLHIYTDLLLLKPVHLYFNEQLPDKNVAINNTENTLDTETSEFNKNKDEQLAATGDFDNEASLTKKSSTQKSYRVALAKAGDDFSTLHGFHFKEHRRMRSGELHYLDHPLLGIIVRISPLK